MRKCNIPVSRTLDADGVGYEAICDLSDRLDQLKANVRNVIANENLRTKAGQIRCVAAMLDGLALATDMAHAMVDEAMTRQAVIIAAREIDLLEPTVH